MAKRRRKRYRGRSVNPTAKLRESLRKRYRAEQVREAEFRAKYNALRFLGGHRTD